MSDQQQREEQEAGAKRAKVQEQEKGDASKSAASKPASSSNPFGALAGSGKTFASTGFGSAASGTGFGSAKAKAPAFGGAAKATATTDKGAEKPAQGTGMTSFATLAKSGPTGAVGFGGGGGSSSQPSAEKNATDMSGNGTGSQTAGGTAATKPTGPNPFARLASGPKTSFGKPAGFGKPPAFGKTPAFGSAASGAKASTETAEDKGSHQKEGNEHGSSDTSSDNHSVFAPSPTGTAPGTGSGLFRRRSSGSPSKQAPAARSLPEGVEQQDIIFQCKAKLFCFHKGSWEERGAGTIIIARTNDEANGAPSARMLMWLDRTKRLVLNALIQAETNPHKQTPKSVSLALVNHATQAPEVGERNGKHALSIYIVRVRPENLEDFLTCVEEHMPETPNQQEGEKEGEEGEGEHGAAEKTEEKNGGEMKEENEGEEKEPGKAQEKNENEEKKKENEGEEKEPARAAAAKSS